MQHDVTTLRDLSIFSPDGNDVFGLINHTTTQAGREMLRQHVLHPPASFEALQEMQEVVRFWARHADAWQGTISNGTLVMLDKFFDSADNVSHPPSGIMLMLGSFMQKLLNKNEYFFTQFSLSHLSDFLKGCVQLTEILKLPSVPLLLKRELETMQEELQQRLVGDLLKVNKDTRYAVLMQLSFNARREMKNMVHRLISHYARLDAWHAMAVATVNNKWTFPQLLPALPIAMEGKDVYHPLLEKPVPYDISFSQDHNFLLLTGANMAGKTTFMRSLGVCALLAHIGMGVPAASLRVSFLQGIITNMQVQDNILKGESYFFAEVQRMKLTASQLLQADPHLVLMDELFKGTNVHDAYECTKAVVEGLLNHPNHLMILSTHLYEVAQHFSQQEKIMFAYFVTQMAEDGSYHFTYELKSGISNDRIGYRILQREGVLDLLNRQTGENK